MAKVIAPPNQRTTRLSVANFGPIAEANIELKPLTVFVGPSNTGKSLFSVLIYVLHRWLAVDPMSFRYGNESSWSRIALTPRLSQEQTKKLRKTLTQWLKTVRDHDERANQLPEYLIELARAHLTRPELGRQFTDELIRCFGIDDLSQLIRQGTPRSASFSLVTSSEHEEGESFEFGGSVFRREFAWKAIIPRDAPSSGHAGLREQMRDIAAYADTRDLDYTLHNLLRRTITDLAQQHIGPFSRSAYYLPADRTGIMHAHRVVVGSLIHRSSRGGLRAERPLPVLSGVVADFLERLVEMPGRYGRQRKINERLALELEQTFLSGAITVHPSETGYPSFVYRPHGWRRDLPLMNASSMVSEVAPVVLFLRYVVQRGDTLIVEEPESHLHPAKQVELTRHLAAAVHAGIRVILTTHSEWVLEALANLVRVSALPPNKRKGIPGAEYALRPHQVGAWMFTPKIRPRGSVVEELPLDVDAGTFPAGYGEITQSLYNEWAHITNRLEMDGQE